MLEGRIGSLYGEYIAAYSGERVWMQEWEEVTLLADIRGWSIVLRRYLRFHSSMSKRMAISHNLFEGGSFR